MARRETAPLTKIRYFVSGKQIFEQNSNRVISPGDAVEFYGTQLAVERVQEVFDLVSETVNTNVTLVPHN